MTYEEIRAMSVKRVKLDEAYEVYKKVVEGLIKDVKKLQTKETKAWEEYKEKGRPFHHLPSARMQRMELNCEVNKEGFYRCDDWQKYEEND